jgi:hypothetical protein
MYEREISFTFHQLLIVTTFSGLYLTEFNNGELNVKQYIYICTLTLISVPVSMYEPVQEPIERSATAAGYDELR